MFSPWSHRPSAFTDAELVKQLDSVTSILDRTERLSNRAQNAASRLKQALTKLKVRQLKHKAIAQGIWDFYPTPDIVIAKMITIADFRPHHHVLEPSAGQRVRAGRRRRRRAPQRTCTHVRPSGLEGSAFARLEGLAFAAT